MTDENCKAVKEFTFKTINKLTGQIDVLNISILEKLQSSYNSYTWPSAPVLAWYLWDHRQELPGKHILELGAGTALPGILAAKCGAYVTLSDSELLPKSLEHIAEICKLNGLTSNQYQVIGLTWGLFLSSIFKLDRIDLIIGSDCFYEPLIFEDLIVTVSFLLEKNPQAKFLTVYHERNSDWSIEHLLNKWNLNCQNISLENLGSDSDLDLAELLRGHTLHLLEITSR